MLTCYSSQSDALRTIFHFDNHETFKFLGRGRIETTEFSLNRRAKNYSKSVVIDIYRFQIFLRSFVPRSTMKWREASAWIIHPFASRYTR